MYRYLKKIGDTDRISARKSKGSSDESIKSPSTTDNNLAPTVNYFDASNVRVKVKGSCLKQDVITLIRKKNSKYLHFS